MDENKRRNIRYSAAKAPPHNVPRFQSTKRFSCSSVRKMRIVVGWRRVHAGSQPLNINIGPSFASDARITPSVDCMEAEGSP